MSSGRLFLNGLLASIARLRFTGKPILNPLGIGHNEFTANGQQCLNCLSQPGGQAQFVSIDTMLLRSFPQDEQNRSLNIAALFQI
jgi:hypothetical protein